MGRAIDAVRFDREGDPRLVSVDTGRGDVLREMKETLGPLALVVPGSALEDFRVLKECEDCKDQKRTGKKKTTVELWRLVGGKPDVIPLIMSRYTSWGRLACGVRKLLDRASAALERNLYLVGVADDVFGQRPGAMGAAAAAGGRARWPIFLQSVKVPSDLEKTYLGTSPKFAAVRKHIMVACGCDLTTLILGETGTGKEIVAREIHLRSARWKSGGPFESLNSAAISPMLLELEMYGCEAKVIPGVPYLRRGRWELADKGTLFLDEIGSMSLDHQGRILRTIETGKIRRIGGERDISVNVRVIAATNRDLEAMVERGEFLRDLYYRLAKLVIYTPPLREAQEDHRTIANGVWNRMCGGTKDPLPEEVLDLLPEYTRAGNVRQLGNILAKLNAYMDTEGLRRVDAQYFRDAMRAPGRESPTADRPPRPKEIIAYRVECLQHLRKTAVVVRKCKVLMRPFAGTRTIEKEPAERLRADLTGKIRELEDLFDDPTLFHTKAVLDATYRFKGKVMRTAEVLGENAGFALRYWHDEVKPLYASLMTCLTEEIGRIEGEE